MQLLKKYLQLIMNERNIGVLSKLDDSYLVNVVDDCYRIKQIKSRFLLKLFNMYACLLSVFTSSNKSELAFCKDLLQEYDFHESNWNNNRTILLNWYNKWRCSKIMTIIWLAQTLIMNFVPRMDEGILLRIKTTIIILYNLWLQRWKIP